MPRTACVARMLVRLVGLGTEMPQKYRILASHADSSPKAGTKTSSYPKSKGKGKMAKPKKAGKY